MFDTVPVTMIAAVVVLLIGALAAGVMPGARAAAEHAGAYFVDPAGYARAALQGSGGPVLARRLPNWTGLGAGLGVVSCVLAIGVAWLGIYAARLTERAGRWGKAGSATIGVLHRLHSGHVGDYVAWLVTGVAAILALTGLPLAGR